MLNYIAGILILVGALFTLTASIGLLRLPDLYTRMHAASKAGTLGSCVVLLALAVAVGRCSPLTLRALAGIAVLPADRADFLAPAGQGRTWRGISLVGHSMRDDLTIAEEKARRAKPAAGNEIRPTTELKMPPRNRLAFGRTNT